MITDASSLIQVLTKNLQQRIKNMTLYPSGIYSRGARLVPYWEINECLFITRTGEKGKSNDHIYQCSKSTDKIQQPFPVCVGGIKTLPAIQDSRVPLKVANEHLPEKSYI